LRDDEGCRYPINFWKLSLGFCYIYPRKRKYYFWEISSVWEKISALSLWWKRLIQGLLICSWGDTSPPSRIHGDFIAQKAHTIHGICHLHLVSRKKLTISLIQQRLFGY
jgi:hypothetical protein